LCLCAGFPLLSHFYFAFPIDFSHCAKQFVLPSFRGQLVGEWAQQVFPRLIANSLHSRLIQDKNAHAYGGGRKTGENSDFPDDCGHQGCAGAAYVFMSGSRAHRNAWKSQIISLVAVKVKM